MKLSLQQANKQFSKSVSIKGTTFYLHLSGCLYHCPSYKEMVMTNDVYVQQCLSRNVLYVHMYEILILSLSPCDSELIPLNRVLIPTLIVAQFVSKFFRPYGIKV